MTLAASSGSGGGRQWRRQAMAVETEAVVGITSNQQMAAIAHLLLNSIVTCFFDQHGNWELILGLLPVDATGKNSI